MKPTKLKHYHDPILGSSYRLEEEQTKSLRPTISPTQLKAYRKLQRTLENLPSFLKEPQTQGNLQPLLKLPTIKNINNEK